MSIVIICSICMQHTCTDWCHEFIHNLKIIWCLVLESTSALQATNQKKPTSNTVYSQVSEANLMCERMFTLDLAKPGWGSWTQNCAHGTGSFLLRMLLVSTVWLHVYSFVHRIYCYWFNVNILFKPFAALNFLRRQSQIFVFFLKTLLRCSVVKTSPHQPTIMNRVACIKWFIWWVWCSLQFFAVFRLDHVLCWRRPYWPSEGTLPLNSTPRVYSLGGQNK